MSIYEGMEDLEAGDQGDKEEDSWEERKKWRLLSRKRKENEFFLVLMQILGVYMWNCIYHRRKVVYLCISIYLLN